jgi:hypothetical protein
MKYTIGKRLDTGLYQLYKNPGVKNINASLLRWVGSIARMDFHELKNVCY